MNGNLGWGLNARNNKRKKVLTGFGGGDDESSDDDTSTADVATTARSAVNRAIAAEQAALRQRAEAAMMAASSSASNVYDYDAEYESFSSEKKKQKQDETAAAAASVATKKDAQPRYITNLLKTAQRRNQEQEVIYERKIAKEQQAEDESLQYEGKEKFITSSYRQKLAEREQWAKDEEERTKREEEEEQRNAANNRMGAGSFMFGTIGRNLLMESGGGRRNDDDNNKNTEESGSRRHERSAETAHNHDRCGQEPTRETDLQWNVNNKSRYPQDEDSTIRSRRSTNGGDYRTATNVPATTDRASSQDTGGSSGVRSRQQILEDRAIKIRTARERYFKRREERVATQ